VANFVAGLWEPTLRLDGYGFPFQALSGLAFSPSVAFHPMSSTWTLNPQLAPDRISSRFLPTMVFAFLDRETCEAYRLDSL
jgi:hypothetical protein